MQIMDVVRAFCSIVLISAAGWSKPEKLYIRECTSGNLRKNWSQGYCVQTAVDPELEFQAQEKRNSQGTFMQSFCGNTFI